MTLLYNRTKVKAKRQRLRNNMTEAEKVLWLYLRKRQVLGYKFRRQYSVGGFIIDFYCTELKLAIEVDGSIHLKEDIIIYDKQREWILRSVGIKFLRFTNTQVTKELNKTIKTISKYIEELTAYKDKQTPISPLKRGRCLELARDRGGY